MGSRIQNRVGTKKKLNMKSGGFVPFLQLLSFFNIVSTDAVIVTDGPLLPNPDLYVEPFDTSISYRQNFCDIQEKFHAGGVELRTAFKDRQINVNIGYDSTVVNFLEDGSIDPIEPGIMVEVLDEVARRGRFSWIDSFVYEKAPPADKTWTDLLVWSMGTYDVTINWWFSTPERVALGASFPTSWYDASQIIIEKQDVDAFDRSEFDPLFWAKPFDSQVWWTMLGTLLLSGLVCLYLEERTLKELAHDEESPVPDSILSLIVTYIHKSFLVVTGHLDLLPNTHAGQIVSFSMSFFAVLLMSAYTANLASFLVVQKASNVQINTVNDIINLGRSICVYQDTAIETELAGMYANANLIPKLDDSEVMKGVANGDCDYGVLALASYELNRGVSEVNQGCTLRRVGRNFKNWGSGFASKSDAGTLCTSLVRDMFNVHLQDMADSGFIAEAWENHNSKKHDITNPQCYSDGTLPSSSITVFDITNLGGIFLLHTGAIVLACSIAFTSRILEKRKSVRKVATDSVNNNQDLWLDNDDGFERKEEKVMDKNDDEILMEIRELTKNMEVLAQSVNDVADLVQSQQDQRRKMR